MESQESMFDRRLAIAIGPRAVHATVVLAAWIAMLVASRPREACGSCGDYVMFGSHRPLIADVVRLSGSAPFDSISLQHPSQSPKPCNSIECSKEYFPPLAPTTIRMIERHDACKLSSDDSPQASWFQVCNRVDLEVTGFKPDRVFRPPRLGRLDVAR